MVLQTQIQLKMNIRKSIAFAMFAVAGLSVASAQDDSKYGATPEDQQKCKENISLYREFRDQKDYASAYEPWKEAVTICPKSALSLYTDGAKFLKSRIKASKVVAERDVMIDSLMWVYDMRMEHFGDSGKVMGYKGVDIFTIKKDPILAYQTFKIGVGKTKEKTVAAIIDLYYRSMFEALKEEKVTKTEMLEEYLVLSEYVSIGMSKAKESRKESFAKVKSNLDEIFVLIATCEDIEAIAKERFEAAPNDLDNVKKLMKILAKRDCTDGDIFTKVAARLNELDPSHESAYALSLSMLKKANYSDALKYSKQAIELAGESLDDLTKLDYYLAAASAAIGAGQASTAASFARKALTIDSNNGKAYLLIGDAIAMSAPNCGDDEVMKKAGYWLAVDYYQKAKSKDANVAAAANSKISAYSKRFPDKKLLFQYQYMDSSGNLKKDPVKIGCWINESTIPRL